MFLCGTYAIAIRTCNCNWLALCVCVFISSIIFVICQSLTLNKNGLRFHRPPSGPTHITSPDISDDSSQGGLSPENSPLITPQSSWRECVIHLTGVSSLEGTPTHRPLAHLGIQRDPSPTPYYRRLAAAIHMADQELKGEVPSRRQSLTPDDASITDCSNTNTPDLKGNRKKNFFKLSPRIMPKTPKKAKNGSY